MSATDILSEATTRLGEGTFTSGLTIPEFAACLHMGLRPVALVQGYCVMKWAWYASGSQYSSSSFWSGNRSNLSSYTCPHGFGYRSSYTSSGYGRSGYQGVEPDHRTWGSNVDQRWVNDAWMVGYNAALKRMIEEAQGAGAHGVIGVVDSSSHLIDGAIREFHMYGTAVVVEGEPPPPQIWTSYLAGERLAKLVEAGFFPVSVVAGLASIRIWSVCATEIHLEGGYDPYGTVQPTSEIQQISDAEMQARQVARDRIKSGLGADGLHGASFETDWEEVGKGDFVRSCTLRGTRVRSVSDAPALPPPVPTVVLR
ncbi:MAG TPA: heavy metal-binding domain-containing protein [Acidimicrobiales bacterium]|jgi:hypothetical protein|nr:heavy metal-binding domain-containing protein [Acidimicrobiales bacterium]